MTYVIADLHFGHSAIIEYESRPFENAQAMDNELIQRWNKTVSKDDKVIVLGDVSFYGAEETKAIIQKLNGYKILVMGNHDTHHPVSWWLDVGFDQVSQYPIIVDEFYILSHEPMYTNRNMPYGNIFGHVHGRPEYVDVSSQTFCVSVERIDYTPIAMEEIKARMKEKRK